MFPYFVHTNSLKIIHGSGKSYYICDIGSSSLKLVWQVIPGGLVFVNLAYHISSPIKWRHAFKQFFFGHKTSTPVGPSIFLSENAKKSQSSFRRSYFR